MPSRRFPKPWTVEPTASGIGLHGLCRRVLSGFQQTLKCRDNRGQTQVTLRLRPMAKILMSTIPAMKPPMSAA
jgi:hypothetical protein